MVADEEWLPFDFVEIGTSDFRTLSQFVGGSDRTCEMGNALRTWNSSKVRGIAVDPVAHLLDRLPVLPFVQKAIVAMGSTDGQVALHSVREDAGKRLPNSYAVWLARGTGSTNGKHPTLLQWLRRDGIRFDDVMETATVPRWSFKTLAEHHKIASIDILKLDCEGADLDILWGLVAYCDTWPDVYPRIISFESNHLSKRSDVQEMLSALEARNYVVIHRGHDTVLKRTGLEDVVCCDFLLGKCYYGRSCYFDHPRTSSGRDVRCCFGENCLRGHGGFTPFCILCNKDAGNDCMFCESCWYPSRSEYLAKVPADSQSAYWGRAH